MPACVRCLHVLAQTRPMKSCIVLARLAYGTLRHTASVQYVRSLMRSICTSQLSHSFYSAWDSTALVLYVTMFCVFIPCRPRNYIQPSRGTHRIHCKNHDTTITCTIQPWYKINTYVYTSIWSLTLFTNFGAFSLR